MFELIVTFQDATTATVTREIEVGVRSDDVIVIGWIDPQNVPLSTTEVQPDVLTVFPVDGADELPLLVRLNTAAYLTRLAAGETIRPAALLTQDPDFVPGPQDLLSGFSRIYVLNWLFKYGGNFCPNKCPPTTFASNLEVTSFVETKDQSYKLFNRFQVKYRPENGSFKTAPQIIRSSCKIGVTTDPLLRARSAGRAGPNNCIPQEINNEKISWTNDGTPTSPAVSAFNTLAQPLLWSNIGSRIEFSVPLVTDKVLFTQIYPTFYVFQNLEFVESIPQAQSPLDVFGLDPYPPGPAPFVLVDGN